MKSGLMLAVATLAATCGMAAKMKPGAKGDQWVIDWGDGYCGATRYVQRGNVLMTFEKPLPGRPGGISFGNAFWKDDPTAGKDAEMIIILHPSGERLMGAVTVTPAVQGTLLRMEGLDAADIDKAAAAQSADLQFGKRHMISVDLKGAPAAFEQLQKCQDDLLAKAPGQNKAP